MMKLYFDLKLIFLFSGELNVYNRWGNLVFSQEDPAPLRWDGKTENTFLQPGVYVWTYTYRINNDERQRTVHGDITIVR